MIRSTRVCPNVKSSPDRFAPGQTLPNRAKRNETRPRNRYHPPWCFVFGAGQGSSLLYQDFSVWWALLRQTAPRFADRFPACGTDPYAWQKRALPSSPASALRQTPPDETGISALCPSSFLSCHHLPAFILPQSHGNIPHPLAICRFHDIMTLRK